VGALVQDPHRTLGIRQRGIVPALTEAVDRHGEVRYLPRVLVLHLDLEIRLLGEVLPARKGCRDDIDLELALRLVLVLLLSPAGAERQRKCRQRPCQHAGA
jgi:hypothetical protein